MAGEAPEWAIPLAEQALQRAADEGRDVPVAELQAEIGTGSEDTAAVLGVLHGRGKAIEEAPGVWRGPYADEPFGAGALPQEPAADYEADGDEPGLAEVRAPQARAGAVETVLTAGMLTHLDAQAIGQLVQAGVQDASGRPFVLRIDP